MWLPANPPMYLSPNWTGPAVTASSRVIVLASGRFRIPMAPTKGANQATEAYWVGVGGFRKPYNLCQAGAADTRVNGQFVPGLIAQDYPSPFKVVTQGIHIGDWIQVEAGLVNGRYEARVTDITSRVTLAVGCRPGPWQHAEWIAESHLNETGQAVLRGAPVFFRGMAVQTKRPTHFHWSMYMGPAAQPFLKRGVAIIRF